MVEMKDADVRAHVLKWYYEQEMSGTHHQMGIADFAKRLKLSRRQVEHALEYLVETGLLFGEKYAGSDVPYVLEIAPQGIDFVGDPEKFGDRYEINRQLIEVTGKKDRK